MTNTGRLLPALMALSAASSPALGQVGDPAGDSRVAQPAAGVELWASTDSDSTDVVKLLGRALWGFEGRRAFQGIAIERAWFAPQGQDRRQQDRIYLDLADDLDEQWVWRARVGTDGSTIIGSAALRSSDWSKEVFLEREIVETPRGVDEGIYYTFAGVSLDFPASERDVFNSVVGIQEFTGKNERLHARGSYVRVIDPKKGLSAQLRTRYFHSTAPGEFDYYSPRNFAQVLPVLQMRRFDRRGWMYLAAAGYGLQKASGSEWESARLFDLRVESPASSEALTAFGEVQYSNNSLNGGMGDYHYLLVRLGVTVRVASP